MESIVSKPKGLIIDQRYEVLKNLKTRETVCVFQCRDLLTNAEVVVKVLPSGLIE